MHAYTYINTYIHTYIHTHTHTHTHTYEGESIIIRTVCFTFRKTRAEIVDFKLSP